MWVDSHCHLFASTEAPELLLRRAAAAEVDWLMCPGIDLETSLQAHMLAAAHSDRVIWAAGLHPHDATRWAEEGARLTSLIAKADAIGECGLDYYRDLSPRSVQRDVFREQLRLAIELEKPIIVHTRDSFRDVFEDVAAAGHGEKVVLHSWTGGPKWTKRFSELGVTFSFAGMVTYPTADTVRRAVAAVAPDRCMVETDTPYLAPVPHRGKPNEPSFVVQIARRVADERGVSLDRVARETAANFHLLFPRARSASDDDVIA
jgi:TatD DNase family protein